MVEVAQSDSSLPQNFIHTCVTCRVVFARADLHREHFKSDWHRYNLKRKMAELPTVTAETFRTKVVELKNQQTESTSRPDEGHRCHICHKIYQSPAAFANHCKSKKHLEIEEKSKNKTEDDTQNLIAADEGPGEDGYVTESDEDDESCETESVLCGEALNLQTCLFCSQSSLSMDENLKHMSLKHGFFIIDVEYCTDLEGLLTYLGQKVGEGFVCLWCNDKGRKFRSLDAVQKHMIDKCHCKMFHDNDAMLEYSDYYDYSSSYPDADKVSESEIEAEVELPVLEDYGYELVLPSGATIGHRSLLIYYKQNLKPTKEVSLFKSQTRQRLVSHYKAIGWTGTTGECAKRKAKDLAFVQKLYSKQRMQVGVKANKLQQHFRSQTNF